MSYDIPKLISDVELLLDKLKTMADQEASRLEVGREIRGDLDDLSATAKKWSMPRHWYEREGVEPDFEVDNEGDDGPDLG